TDSHTTMINGLGILGWGVGGIEAEAVMLGQPVYMLIPEVVGFCLSGKLADGATATDLVLKVTQMLREHGVVGKFVEFFGPGLADMPLANRATIANMAPEYGATVGFFPVDEQTIRYLRQTGRPEELVEAVEWYYKEQGLWLDTTTQPVYSSELELDLSTIVPALAGPKRPQDRIDLTAMQETWNRDLVETFGHTEPLSSEVTYEGETFDLEDGDVVIAAITSCTNTSNPSVMIGAGLLAKHAVAKGLTRKPWVKTSLAPGSKVVTDYLEQAELTPYLEKLGFHTVGYGCTTCIGNSGPLPDEIAAGVEHQDLVVTSVLSGNRNFEGRISPHVKANYLASPPLVVAYALAGTVDIDFDTDPIGTDPGGNPVMLSDIWPSATEIAEVVGTSVETEQFTTEYGNVFEGSDEWKAIATSEGDLYEWNEDSTYVQEPPFFEGLSQDVAPIAPITGARVLVKVGDSVTTDHISPAGNIAEDAPAGRFLLAKGVAKKDFNSYGSRRGNDRVMTRGTFANIRVRNQLAPGTEGGWTTDFTTGEVTSIYEASLNYRAAGTPLVVLAGIDYGMGSSRDWAAKGTFLLGVKAVIAKSFERIHRSNLIGMGVLPLTFAPGDDADALGLDGTEMFSVEVDDSVVPRQDIPVVATKADGTEVRFTTTCRLDTPVEVQYYRNGGILHTVLLRMARED
ncbi:MAG: aconitate hydratase AcnA, partial [Acidimicrobiia bacterium]